MENLQLQGFTMTPMQKWELAPTQMIDGLEVFNNMKKPNIAGGDGAPIEEDYKEIRKVVIRDGFAIVGAFAPHKLGKGGLVGSLDRLARGDRYLNSRMGRGDTKRQFLTVPLPLAQCIQACKIADVPEQFSIGPGKEATHNYLAAQLQRYMMLNILTGGDPSIRTREDLILSLKDRQKAYLFLLEGSIPVIDPIPFENRDGEMDINYSGITDQISGVLRAGVDPMTRDNMFTYTIEEDPLVRDDIDSNNLRAQLQKHDEHREEIFASQTVPVITIGGKDIEISKLPLEQQQYYLRVMRGSMATPEIIKRDAQWMDYWVGFLWQNGVIPEPSVNAYYQHLRIATGQSPERFVTITNTYFEEPKRYYMNYLVDSGVAREYPDVINNPSVFDHVAKPANRMK